MGTYGLTLGILLICTAVVLIDISVRQRTLRHAISSARDTSGVLSFSPKFSEPVAMWIQDSSHYRVDTDDGAQEFAHLLPHGGHTVHIDEDAPGANASHPRVYTVTLFHQLKCLDAIRGHYADVARTAAESSAEFPPPAASPLIRHCLNYLRQTVMCRPNLRIEPVVNPVGMAMRGYDTVCRDWASVYEEAERNYEEFRGTGGERR